MMTLRRAAQEAYEAERRRETALHPDIVDQGKAHLQAAIEKTIGPAWSQVDRWDYEGDFVIGVVDQLRFRLLFDDLEVERVTPCVNGLHAHAHWETIKSMLELGCYLAIWKL